jgi:hypothetical protein
MALRFIDSAGQHYLEGTSTSAYVSRKWTYSPNATVINNGGGRRGLPYLNPGGQSIAKTLTQTLDWYMGVAYELFGGESSIILQLWNNFGGICQLNLNSDATLSVVCAGNTIFTSTLAVTDPSTWHYYEVAWSLNGSTNTGSMTGALYVDGLLWGNYNGTGNAIGGDYINGSFTANQVGFSGPGGFMDFYAFDNNTTDINGFPTTNTKNIGDIQVQALLPITDVTTNWSDFGGTNTTANSCVNDFVSTSEGTFSSPDDDTSYVYSSSTGSAEAFNYQSISTFTGTIFGAQYSVCAKKTAEGSREIALTVGTATVSSENFLGTNNYLSDYYVYYICPLDNNPSTVGSSSFGVWTPANYDSQSFGVVLSG